MGVVTELAHIPEDAEVSLELSDPTDEDPIEWVNIHVRSTALPVFTEVVPIDEPSDHASLPTTTEREMVPHEGNLDEPLSLDEEEITVAELRQILRDKDMPVSGTKAELIARLNDAE
jgi:hypothetical protein